MSTAAVKRENVPVKVKTAIAYMLEQKADLVAAAQHAGIAPVELRRYMGKPQVRRYALEQRQIALEVFCAGSPAALTRVRDESENGMAVVASVKAGEQLRVGAIEAEGAMQRRQPGLTVVVLPPLGSTGEAQVAFQAPSTRPPMLDVTPKPQPVPAMQPDADAE
jgi:hypothetical protein